MRRFALLALLVMPTAACTGLTMGENEPGADTWLEAGSIAVDPVTEKAFVMSSTRAAWSQRTTKTLWAVPPDSGGAKVLADMSAYSDVRILFPHGRIMLMGEIDGRDELRTLDADSFTQLERKTMAARYNGTRLSASGDFLAVADNNRDPAPIHVIETDSLEVHEIPPAGDWLEAMWLHTGDTLLAVIFYNTNQPDAYARLLAWDVGTLAAAGFPVGDDGLWAQPSHDVIVEGASYDMFFSYTWVGISPNDAYAVIPVLLRAPGEAEASHRLLVWQLGSDGVGIVDDARGPVGFTPDGSTIVSYRYLEGDRGQIEARLVMVDVVTLEQEMLDLPDIDLPEFFVTRDGNFVLIASSLGGSQLLLYDAETGEQTQLEGPGLDLNEFVSRSPAGELWLVDDGLYRLDLFAADLEKVSLSWIPAHVNILRQRDLLVLDDAASARLVFFDPVGREVVHSVALVHLGS